MRVPSHLTLDRRTRIAFSVSPLLFVLAFYSPAQEVPARAIIFNRYTGEDKLVQQLVAMNPDGTGEHEIAVNLPECAYPVCSRDGEWLAVTSVDPDTPFAWSRNVYTLDLLTGKIRKITSFSDRPVEGGSSLTMAYHKAFSPDKTRIAVAKLTASGSGDAQFDGTPMLEVYTMDGTPRALVTIGSLGGNTIHAGDGVDWSPKEDLLAYPKDIKVRVVDPVGQVFYMPVTPIFVMQPVDDALAAGKGRQLTSPQAAVQYTWSGIFNLWQTDFAPAFSPDGQRVAYLRAENALSGTAFYPELMTIRVVNLDGSNDHAILSFNLGEYISRLSWSPDGTKLVYDLADQAVNSSGVPLLMADVTKSKLYTVNADGSGVTRIHDPAATSPAWYPGPGIGAPPKLNVAFVQDQGRRKLLLSWPVAAGQNYVLRSVEHLGDKPAWAAEGAVPIIVGNRAQVTLEFDKRAKFYQLVRP